MRYISLFFIIGTLLLPVTALAGFGLKETADAALLSGYGQGSLEVSLGTVIGAALSLIGIVFFVLVIYGGIMWMTAGGNQELVKKGMNTIISAAIGLVVVLSAYAITNFVLESVGSQPGPSPSSTPSGGAGNPPPPSAPGGETDDN